MQFVFDELESWEKNEKKLFAFYMRVWKSCLTDLPEKSHAKTTKIFGDLLTIL